MHLLQLFINSFDIYILCAIWNNHFLKSIINQQLCRRFVRNENMYSCAVHTSAPLIHFMDVFDYVQCAFDYYYYY